MDALQDRIEGSMIGGAIGDALGYPVEFVNSFEGIQRLYGENGITHLNTHQRWLDEEYQAGKAVFSDDTQMTLFTANGLLNAVNEGKPLIDGIREAYLEWLQTQEGERKGEARCWIRDIPSLNHRRAPGATCTTALNAISKGEDPMNNSKGCGGLMRTAPIALYSAVGRRLDIEDADRISAEAAHLTHLHPDGFLPSVVESHIIYRLLSHYNISKNFLLDATEEGIEVATSLYPQLKRQVQRLHRTIGRATELLDNGKKDVDNINEIGEGWTGDEALAIALYCCNRHIDSFEKTIIAAVNHGGDSDSTGAVAGNIIGAALGYGAIPKSFLRDLESPDLVIHMADDLYKGEATHVQSLVNQ